MDVGDSVKKRYLAILCIAFLALAIAAAATMTTTTTTTATVAVTTADESAGVTSEKSWFLTIIEKILFLVSPQPRAAIVYQPVAPTPAPTPQPFVLPSGGCSGLDSDIIIYEKATGAIQPKGAWDSFNTTGRVIVRNRSAKDRIWDVNLYMKDMGSTDLKNSTLHVNELAASDKMEFPYKSMQDETPILYEESYDTFSPDSQSQAYFVYGVEQPVSLSIRLRNNWERPLQVSFQKRLPALTRNVRVAGADYFVNTSTVSFSGVAIRPGQEVSVKIDGIYQARSISNVTFGDAKIAIAGFDGTFSGMSVNKSDAISLNYWSLKKSQDENNPSLWHIVIAFEDLSDFNVRMNRVAVYDESTGDVVGEWSNLDETLKPGERWSRNITYTSTHAPPVYFSHQISYTVLPEIGKCSEAEFTVKPSSFEVADLDLTKTLNPPGVQVGENKTINVTIELANTGSAPISELVLQDDICSGFTVDSPKAVYYSDAEKMEPLAGNESYGWSVESGILKFSMPSIQSVFGRVLAPSDKMVFSYTLIPTRPAAGVCKSEAVAYGNTDPRGPQVRASSAAPISIAEGLQGAEIAKSMVAGATDDQIRFILQWKNTGRADTPEVQMRDFIPGGFRLVNSTGQPKLSDAPGGQYIDWALGKIKVGDGVTIEYTIEGHGTYSAGEALLLSRE